MRFLAILVCSVASAQTWQVQESGTTANLRGLSVVSDKVAWASGSKGTILRTVDGGSTWTSVNPQGASDADFRDIEAINERVAYAMAAGPARASRIYKTTDAGATWTLQRANQDPDGFWDSFGMWDATHGILMGDPVNGRFMILITNDGQTWSQIDGPKAEKGEAAFAASGTALITRGTREAWFATGGVGGGRVFHTEDAGRTWTFTKVLKPASESSGIYSLSMCGRKGFAVGGDYTKPTETTATAWLTLDGGKSWNAAGLLPRGYRSAVDCEVPVTVGTSGSELWDGSARSAPIDATPLNAVTHSPERIWAVGPNGAIATYPRPAVRE